MCVHAVFIYYNSFCILVDDIVDTGGTMANAVKMLHSAGASKITAFARSVLHYFIFTVAHTKLLLSSVSIQTLRHTHALLLPCMS